MRSSRWSSLALSALSALALAAPAGGAVQHGSLVVPITAVDTGAVLIEGGIPYATVRRNPGGRAVVRRRIGGHDRFAVRRALAPGRYRLTSWIRDCEGNC